MVPKFIKTFSYAFLTSALICIRTLVSLGFFLLFMFFGLPFMGENKAFSKKPSIRELLLTPNKKSLDRYLKLTASLKKERLKCQLQLKKNRVPASCYTWITQSKAYKNPKPFLQYLDEKCSQNAPKINQIKEARELISALKLSAFCKNTLISRIKVLEYQLRDQKPKDFLKKAFRKEH